MAKNKPKCSFKKTYRNPIELTEDTWKCGTKKQKTALLNALGLHKSFAETKTMEEMVKRGGGLAAKEILNLERIYLKNKGGEVTVNWT